MQARAVFEAAAIVQKEGIKVQPEIMIPLVGFKKELDLQIEVVHQAARDVQAERKVKLNYMVGTMIEIPRGALTADEIAQSAEFFSFGTNDLTQTALGMSRDDSGSFLAAYAELEIVKKNPFATIDQTGVGQLVEIAVTKGRKTRPEHQARHLRRARRRSLVDSFLREGRARLRELLAVPRAGGAAGGGAGGAVGEGGRLITVYIYQDGKTRTADRVEPQWLDPASGVTLWVDVVQPTPEEGRQLLADTFHFHPLSIEDALSEVPTIRRSSRTSATSTSFSTASISIRASTSSPRATSISSSARTTS